MNEIKVFVKPAGDSCNLDCKYCYADGKPEKSPRMSIGTYRKTLEMVKGIPRIHQIFHGGEPLLMGHDFFEEAMEMNCQILQDSSITTDVQSNLTLLDDEWVNLFRRHKIGVGTSVDGSREMHDSMRTYPDGRGSYDDVRRGIGMLNDAGVNVGAVATFSKGMEGRAEEFYQAMRSSGLKAWKLDGMQKSGRNNDEEVAADLNGFAKTFIEIADMYFWDRNCPVFVTAEMLLKSYFWGKKGYSPNYHCQKSEITVQSDGTIIPCGHFTQNPEYVLGTVDDSIEDIFSHPIKAEMQKGYSGCQSCEYDGSCFLRCPYNSFTVRGRFDEKDSFCILFRSFYTHMENLIKGGIHGKGGFDCGQN